MDKIKKLTYFLNKKKYNKEVNFLLKIARDSDLVYLVLIDKIINLFKNKSIKITSDINMILYRIDLRDLDFYDYTILDPRVFGDYLDLAIYGPEYINNSSYKYQNFGALYRQPTSGANPSISFYLNLKNWEDFNKSGASLQEFIKKNEGDLKHEIIHFLDSTRFLNVGDEKTVSTYGGKNVGYGSFGYVNSTEELQARIMSMISFVMDGLFEGDLNKNLHNLYYQKWLPIYENKSGTKREIFLATLIYYVANNDINLFINHIFNASSTFFIGDKNLLEKTKKRYMKRLYDLFITLKNKLENKKLSDYEDLPEFFEL